ncbi:MULTISPECIES: hypothetical protein [unclassified Mesorhizobium]|uniref:hypothetical protein n=1 Tax=unclassified Mesorhizobium TaxID=325217 RepID=UPI000FD9FCC6|nr:MULTISPECIES: hypothetical protein [unclassified Mesorhizobium]TGR18808.1 hypothetical protein EN840_30705 [Mesorhizobium sp. M8A.F.Ca.ET.197.01.1.1]TGR37072.1 hypothetical protein EN842_51355 [bacterium M00.F.Ca.ET.199.01.1.1]TGR41590.1 hypothetical protein EN841_30815 [Mesorhizobium sp. M8A.F.Ca.ET.198.01.1.1]TGV85301.1 hypothetical protein EN792_019635 [Mesorhizobium sp. M00.F.Ca.ET.149.01.1.1]
MADPLFDDSRSLLCHTIPTDAMKVLIALPGRSRAVHRNQVVSLAVALQRQLTAAAAGAHII